MGGVEARPPGEPCGERMGGCKSKVVPRGERKKSIKSKERKKGKRVGEGEGGTGNKFACTDAASRVEARTPGEPYGYGAPRRSRSGMASADCRDTQRSNGLREPIVN